MFQDLVHNLCIVLALGLLYSLGAGSLRKLGERGFSLAVGSLFGLIAAAGVWLHVEVSPGVIIDPRAVMAGIAGMYFGPLTAVVTAGWAALARIGVGGAGTLAGVGLPFGGAALGLLFYAQHNGRKQRWGWKPLLLLGICEVAQTEVFALLLPPGHREHFLAATWFPLLLLFPAGTVLLGLLVSHTHQRLASEEQLKASRRELQDVLDGSRDLIYRLDDEGSIVFVNRAVVRYGYRPEQLIGRPILDFVHPEDRPRVRERLTSRLSGSAAEDSFELRCFGRDGEVLHLVSRAALVEPAVGRETPPLSASDSGPHGKTTYIQGVAHEVTEQRRMEREHERLLAVIREMPNLVATVAPDGRIQDANPAFRRVVGWPAETQSDSHRLWEVFPAEFRSILRDEAFPRARREGLWRGRTAVLSAEGREVPVSQLVLAHRDENGDLAQYSTMMVDITDRLRAEEALRENRFQLSEALDATGAGLVDVDLVAETLRLDHRCSHAMGLDTEEIVLSSAEYDERFVHPEDREIRLHQLREIRNGTRRQMDCAYRVRNQASGAWRWLRAHGKVAGRDPAGEPVRMLGTFTDITEHRSLQQQLQQAQKMEALGTLAGGIAHDFNNILSAMVGYTELALDAGPADPHVRDALNNVLAAGNRAADLVRQILTFSRESRGDPRPVQTALLVKEATKLLRATLPSTIAVHNRVHHQGLVWADPIQLHQVLINLCTNAGRAMAEGGGTLTIRLDEVVVDAAFCRNHPDLKPGPHQRLTVSDTGTGIAPENMDRLFDPFFTTCGDRGGSGLGLSVVHGIVKDCGGAVTVESQLGEGSTFQVYLPAATASPAALEPPETQPIRTGTESILFVDDEPFQVDLAVQRLERLGYRVCAFTDSAKALEAFKNAPDDYDVVITDLMMPHLPGDVLARRLLLIRPSLPIILCTGFSGDLTEAKAQALGIHRLVKKPVAAAELGSAIREALREDTVSPHLQEKREA